VLLDADPSSPLALKLGRATARRHHAGRNAVVVEKPRRDLHPHRRTRCAVVWCAKLNDGPARDYFHLGIKLRVGEVSQRNAMRVVYETAKPNGSQLENLNS
jgi:hypothetical protein